MPELTENERKELADLIRRGEPVPAHWRARLFPEAAGTVEVGREDP